MINEEINVVNEILTHLSNISISLQSIASSLKSLDNKIQLVSSFFNQSGASKLTNLTINDILSLFKKE